MAPLDDSVSSENEVVEDKSKKCKKDKKSKKHKKSKKDKSESEGELEEDVEYDSEEEDEVMMRKRLIQDSDDEGKLMTGQ